MKIIRRGEREREREKKKKVTFVGVGNSSENVSGRKERKIAKGIVKV